MSLPDIPQPFKSEIKPTAPFDVDVDAALSGTVETKLSGGVETKVSGGLSTDSKVDILNLPHFTLQDIKDMMKVRMRIPNYSNVCFKMFGVEFFSICIGGEGQVITEPYVPNAAEKCEVSCCEPDTRPFPEANTIKPVG
jgi:hypothetical protein